MSDDCSLVQCFRPECRKKCGYLKWFGNLSDCDVTLEYKLEDGTLWHSLGQYPPGNHSELGGGALLLPSTSTVRAVETKSGKVLANWGTLGQGFPSLFIDTTMCSQEKPSATPLSTSSASSLLKSTRKKTTWLLVLGGMMVVVLGFILGFRHHSIHTQEP
jgi:hypothetical protein